DEPDLDAVADGGLGAVEEDLVAVVLVGVGDLEQRRHRERNPRGEKGNCTRAGSQNSGRCARTGRIHEGFIVLGAGRYRAAPSCGFASTSPAACGWGRKGMTYRTMNRKKITLATVSQRWSTSWKPSR